MAFRKRFNQEGEGSDNPQKQLNLPDGVILDSAFVERFEPESVHVEERMEEDDDFLAFGTEIWEYDIAEGREDEFKFALVNSGVVLESEEIETEPAT
ncbi:MAG: hypothetical protein M3Z36_13105 [Acidobacteriota bacterium]|nr:hypothetical protein [Acidobacteriota bacterium]